MPFSNPIVGGVVLRIPAIQSPNFVHGVSGWTINRDGTAEFHGLTLVYTSAGDGVFLYNGTPAAGNLFMSMSPVAGTDPYGNSYPAGLSSYSGARSVVIDPTVPKVTVTNAGGYVSLDPSGAVPTLFFGRSSGHASWVNSPSVGVLEASSTDTGSTRTRLILDTASGILEYVAVPSDTNIGGLVYVNASGVALERFDGGGTRTGLIMLTSTGVTIEGAAGAWGPLALGTISYAGGPAQIYRDGSTVITTNGSGLAAINTGLTTINTPIVCNGDSNAIPNGVISVNSISGGVITVKVQALGGGTVNNATCRVNWMATGT